MSRKSSQRTSGLLAELRSALGDAQPTLLRITQQPFDHDPGHLFRMVALAPGDEPEPVDLVDYCLDLQYMEAQPDLLRYALPLCLRAWRQSVLGDTTEYESFMEHFPPAIVDGGLFERLLSEDEGRAVQRFFVRTILDAIDAQDALPFSGYPNAAYPWISELTTAGVVLPEIADLWRAWWSIESTGPACAAIQYASCLIYADHDNPVFPQPPRGAAGGPPELWEFSGFLYNRCWRAENVAFLRATLTVEKLEDVVKRAADRLEALPMGAMAATVHADFKARREVVEARCRELPDILATKQGTPPHFEWSR